MLNKININAVLLSFLITSCSNLGLNSNVPSPSPFQPLDVIDGAGLYKQQLPDGNEAYLQVIDLQKMQVDQIVGEADNMGFDRGNYYQGEGKYYSPFFKMKVFSEVEAEYKKLYDDSVFSLINCSFFEQYQSSSQLSFPIKLNGTIITGGSSPYGPIAKPKDGFYTNIRLKALVWDDNSAYITDYNPNTGKPLNDTTVQNAIVSYEYNDHPAKVFGGNQKNRYHLIGTLDKDGISGDELLMIMTVNRATIDEAADLLKKLGVKSDIITIDGGISTYLFNSRLGNITLPQSVNLKDNPEFRNLPHYLGFRTKVKKDISPQIKVSQPGGKVVLEKDKPYLILWRDNLDSKVRIDLYEGNKRIREISPTTDSDGVYEWIPDIPVKEGYSLRISDLENPEVFGTLLFP